MSTGCVELDSLLQGGIPFLPITEVTGESGVGKSQLLLKLALTCQLPIGCGGLGGGCVIISTEGKVPLRRLRDFLHTCPSLQPLLESGRRTEDDVLAGVFLDDGIFDADALWIAIKDRLPVLLSRGQENGQAIRLVIVDSITSVFRGMFLDNTKDTMMQRNNWFFGLTGFMRQLYDVFGCMFVCANQVTTDLARNKIIPALGLAWSNCVNQRFTLRFVVDNGGERPEDTRRRRSLEVDFSPELPCGLVTNQLLMGSFGLKQEYALIL